MMMKFITFLFISLVMSSLAPTKVAACAVMDLAPCLSAVQGGSQPSAECCTKLKDNQSCFCDYLKDPLVGPFLSAGKKVLADCNVPIPSC
ncbi:hypothetical protein CARUB_v10011969mg [Capsella rubella]|uniref:Bifunctional inhibitor/plant lipid transfer protein/seed storage helical domain-containing protein n=1 Tax=Capsella rubella TaxID=81985 RepID=R0IKQ9_9BRAS|nr:hypothetical protein CARUB_v10011969mg [Capsella rubella]